MKRSVLRGRLKMLCVVGLVMGVTVLTSRGQELEWRSFEEALATADSTDRFVMVAVYAPWCGWCRKMKKEVYSSDGVRECLRNEFVMTRLNRDDTELTYRYQGRSVTPRRLVSTFRAEGVPATVFLSPRGEYVVHLSGYVEPDPLRLVLGYLSTHAYRQTRFAEYRAQTAVPCDEGGRSE